MIKIIQFGEGNFLRTFVDVYFDTLNQEGGNYQVDIVKPITFGSLENFIKQNNKYNIVLRGVKNGKADATAYPVNVINSVLEPEQYDGICSLFADNELKIIVSNTTEAGICYNGNDKIEGFIENTFPAKLTKLLLHRFNANENARNSDLYLMPVELIDNNADALYDCVKKYIALWNLPKEFEDYIDNKVFFCNTLVDRIVSGAPRTEEDKASIKALIGKEDLLVSIGEPFGLWAVEDKGEISKFVKDGVHNIEVVLTKDINYYKKRKVRVLNGSHTNLVSAGLLLGATTVYDCMQDKTLCKFLNDTLDSEIVPFVSNDISATKVFADSIIERFSNPYLNHQLISIHLNSVSKWKARVLPSFKDYYTANGKIAPLITVGFAYLLALYTRVYKEGEKYYCDLPVGKTEIKDDIPYLEFFANGGCPIEFMKKTEVWGEDLTAYNGFAEKIGEYIEQINAGKVIL
ncbi:MAG: tagaturonate reductase [Clostridia bacterium]|nr:tagaturonate reductase [Clostridia bacterium]